VWRTHPEDETGRILATLRACGSDHFPVAGAVSWRPGGSRSQERPWGSVSAMRRTSARTPEAVTVAPAP